MDTKPDDTDRLIRAVSDSPGRSAVRGSSSDTFIVEIKRISIPLDGTEGSHSMMKVSGELPLGLAQGRTDD